MCSQEITAIFHHLGIFTEKFLFPLLIQTGLVLSLEENYYKKCYVLNPLLIQNSEDSILLHNKINLPDVQFDTKDNVLDSIWCATPVQLYTDLEL